MGLYIDVRVNDKVVATARVQNQTDEGDICDYAGDARTEPWAGRSLMGHSVVIWQHDRQKSVWSLVAKIAGLLAERERA